MNVELNPEPFTTLYTWSDNGSDWGLLEETGHPKWLFWRPRKRDGVFYVPTHWYLHNKSIQIVSLDTRTARHSSHDPCLFVPEDRVFAVGRYQPRENLPWQNMGSAFIRIEFVWFTGLLSPSPPLIRMARIDLNAMVRKADSIQGQ
jgi:hypothetical protein